MTRFRDDDIFHYTEARADVREDVLRALQLGRDNSVRLLGTTMGRRRVCEVSVSETTPLASLRLRFNRASTGVAVIDLRYITSMGY